jgi:hypothetical protein
VRPDVFVRAAHVAAALVFLSIMIPMTPHVAITYASLNYGILVARIAAVAFVYGLYGPRGSGKSWLMRRAITEATAAGGTGLWFPCPSGYEPTAFLSMLADTLASQVENLRAEPSDSLALRGPARRRRVDRRENRRLARQAAELREQSRFATTSLKRSSQASLSASYHGTAGITRTRETNLAEREPTVASLVFNFRRFAGR